MDVLGEWNPSLRGVLSGERGRLVPDWKAWELGTAPSSARRAHCNNATSLDDRLIQVEVLQVRAPDVARTTVDPSRQRHILPVPPQDAPYVPMEIDVRVVF